RQQPVGVDPEPGEDAQDPAARLGRQRAHVVEALRACAGAQLLWKVEGAIARHGRGIEQRAEEGALPRAVRPEQADAVVAAEGEMHVGQRVAGADPDDGLVDAEPPRHRRACLGDVEMPAEPPLVAVACRLRPNPLERMVDQTNLTGPRLLGGAAAGRLERATRGAVARSLHALAGAHLAGGLCAAFERGREAALELLLLHAHRTVGLLYAPLL